MSDPDDLLAQMTRALRDEHDGATAVPEATRSRVIRSLGERRPRRRKWLAVGVPLFVIFGGSTAWAAATGKLERIVETALSIVRGDDPEEQEPLVEDQSKGLRSAPNQRLDEQTPADEEAPEEEEEETPEEEELPEEPKGAEPEPPSPTVAAPPKPPAPPTPATQASPEPEPPEEDHTALLTYRSAHRAHFSNQNCAVAIRGYEEYLSLEPNGPFAVDARYNRGVCLLRVGRTADARLALQPFANGTYGTHRQSQATELLEALKKSAQ